MQAVLDKLPGYNLLALVAGQGAGPLQRLLAHRGPTLWFHFALCFGAAASVWNFNGAGALQFLTRALLFVVGRHYVDDFNGVDADDLADFADFFKAMGLRTLPRSKAQEPWWRHVIHFSDEGVILSSPPPCKHLKKILAASGHQPDPGDRQMYSGDRPQVGG